MNAYTHFYTFITIHSPTVQNGLSYTAVEDVKENTYKYAYYTIYVKMYGV